MVSRHSQFVLLSSRMQQNTEQEVIELLARFSSWESREISPELSLFHDLGMDGADASDFFEAFSQQFSVDLSSLYLDWNRYFKPDGWTTKDVFKTTSGIFLIGIPVVIMTSAFGLPQWASNILGLLALLVWLIPLRAWPWKPQIVLPISVRDLVLAATSRRWPLDEVRINGGR